LKAGSDDFLPNYADYGVDQVYWNWTARSLWGGQWTGFYDCWTGGGTFLSRNNFNAWQQMHITCFDSPNFGQTTWVRNNP
jgi:hypothetical protein